MASVPDSGCALRLRRSPVISPAADLGHRGIVQSNHCDCIVRAGYSTEVGMGSQTAGYATDVPYARTFIRELAPAFLDHVAIVSGFMPPARDGGFAFCDLGCGQGVTTVILAATNPLGRFYGIDAMPSHIQHARRFA